MNKQLCVISAPPDTYSGYGARSRDFIKALYELRKDVWDFQIVPQRWGSTGWGFIEDYKEEWGWMKSLFLKAQPTSQPDIWIQISVPNEFQPVGKFSIGITAGIETTVCDAGWLDGVNRMNLVLVSSRHAKQVFENTSFQEKDKQTDSIKRSVKLLKPVEVLFEGVDLNSYFYIDGNKMPTTDLTTDLDTIKESFAYLYVGHWLQGEIGEDRKNTGLLVKLFLETFKDKKKRPALILKTSSATSCVMDRDEILKKIDAVRETVEGKDLPNIYLVHGDLDDKGMNILYNHPKVKAMVSLTKGEGYGRPLAEFCLSKKPVITSGWSGPIDFLNPEFSMLLPGELKQIHPSAVVANMLIPESFWFTPNQAAAVKALEEVFENYSKYEVGGKRQGHKIKTEFSYDSMRDLLDIYLEKYVPKQVELKLPQLKKITLPELVKVETETV